MEATAPIGSHSRARAPAPRRAARAAAVLAATEIRAGLPVAPTANTGRDAIQEEAEAAAGTEVEVAESEIALVLQVAAVDQAGHSPSLAWKRGRKETLQRHHVLL